MSRTTDVFLELAERVSASARSISAAFQKSGVKPPTFEDDHAVPWPIDARAARLELLHAAEELQRIATSPLELLMDKIQPEITTMRVIIEFNIAQAVPLTGTATYAEIADGSGLAEREVRRVLRLAMMDRIFRETQAGTVAHTAASRLLASDRNLLDWADISYGEIIPAQMEKTVQALKKSPASDKPNESGFAYSNERGLDLFSYFKADPKRAKVFGSAMGAEHRRSGFEIDHLIGQFPAREGLGKGGICVDIGGSNGSVMMALAGVLPEAHCVVQDLPSTISQQAPLPVHLRGRVEFMAHDFFDVQPIKGACVYLLRNVLHNWSDADCLRILERIVAAMDDGSRVVINDWCLADDGVYDIQTEKQKRRMDINMLSLLNSRERSISEWKQLIENGNLHLRVDSLEHSAGSNYSIIVLRKTSTQT